MGLLNKLRNSMLLTMEGIQPGSVFVGKAKGLVRSGDGSDKDESLIVQVYTTGGTGRAIYLTFGYLTKDGAWKEHQIPKKAVTIESLMKLIREEKLSYATSKQVARLGSRV